MAFTRSIRTFLVAPAVHGGFGIFAQGLKTIDGGEALPFMDLFAVGSDAAEAGATLTAMLDKIDQNLEDQVDPDAATSPDNEPDIVP